jgi:hypothetical protein
MLEWGHIRFNSTSICWNEVSWELIAQYAGMRPHQNQLMCYWFSCDLFPMYWCVIDSHVTSIQHTDLLLIIMWPHSSIPMCYWFSWWGHMTIKHLSAGMRSHENQQHISMLEWGIMRINNTLVCWMRSPILMWPHSTILRYCWFSWYLIPAY